MKMNSHIVAWGIIGLGANTCFAQGAENGRSANPESTGGLEEIVVTAQRREQNLQDVPIAVTALSGAELERMGVASVSDLNTVTPGFTLTTQRNALTPYLRGVGTATAVGAEEGTVPVYLDGLLISSLTSAAFALPNVQRVEVLKGPQGTLFGRNSVGGLVNVVTKDPSATPGGSANISVENYETLTASLYATGAVSDKVTMDVTAYVRNQGEGWGRNVNYSLDGPNLDAGLDANYRNETVLRSKVLIQPNDDTRITLMGDYQQLENEIGLALDAIPGATITSGYTKAGSFYDTQLNLDPRPKAPQWGLAARVEHNFDFATLTSSSGYRRARSSFNFDADATPVAFVNAPEVDQLDTFQQEFLLTGESGSIEWTGGVFYFYSRADYDTSLNSTVLPFALNMRLTSQQTTNSYAAFGQATYHLTDRLDLTAGLRYTRDERDFRATQVAMAGNADPVGTVQVNRNPDNDSTTELTNEEPTWRLSLDYKLTDDLLVYGSYNRGFKSGIFNQTSPTALAVQPETLDAYEAGFKSDLLGRTLRVNAAAFYNDYQNVQLQRGVTSQLITFNAPGAEIYGAELEVIAAPPLESGNLQLRAGTAYLHGRYKDFPDAPFSSPLPVTLPFAANLIEFRNAKGNKTVRTPPVTYTASVSYDTPVAFGRWGFGVNYYYTDGFYWEVDNRVKQRAYGLLSGEVSLQTADERWRFTVFGRNLTDEQYHVNVFTGSGGDFGGAGAPRTYGASVGYNF